MKRFNITGKCIPGRHYMVDISERLETIKSMIDQEDYFCINRGRQYGKTTTLSLLKKHLESEYSVFSISLEGIGDSSFETDERMAATFLHLLNNRVELNLVHGLSDETRQMLAQYSHEDKHELSLLLLKSIISKACINNPKGIVLLIDEVDQASNYHSFIKLLGLLRDLYLNRDEVPTFQSVILAGVYDIKNLKLKIRGAEDHQYNSPWNIAVPFNEDMSLHADGIRKMLDEYEDDHHTGMDTAAIAQSIYDYTSGYPFLVTRLCMLMDESKDWTKEGLLNATKVILTESSTLFDDIKKKLTQFPELKELLYHSIFEGKAISFNADNHAIDIARMFDYVYNDNGIMRISNRLFETRLYNLFISEGEKTDVAYSEGLNSKPEFIKGGQLNMLLILERFALLYANLYDTNRDLRFDEEEGRKKFLFFIKPIINGIGNYYVEAQTRDMRRTDLVIDYLGHQYIVELKIWHGEQYNKDGEEQLADYLDAHAQDTGYLLTFNFNKKKKQSLQTKLIKGKTIVEVVV